MTRKHKQIRWNWSSHGVMASSRPVLMGILNVTPDSFSDGGLHWTPRDAVERAIQMHREGAAIIDVGGESTRPGADRISSQDQIDRVVPVIRAMREQLSLPISIDTTSAEVADAALSSGASIVNDVSAGREDASMLSMVAQWQCGLILMHRLVPPDEDRYSTDYESEPEYDDVLDLVRAFLLKRARAAESAGVPTEAIMLDPGLGFGKSVKQNWQLINGCSRLTELGYPVLAAASRKSFLKAVRGGDVAPRDRGPASVAASIIQFQGGCRLFRVHDVALHAAGLAHAAESDSGPAMM
ncbi:MAG: dihydropteroate synthase [Phycisphaerales bacterium]|nr:dihydropteroate synthase [Phycisphaerales bacterium]